MTVYYSHTFPYQGLQRHAEQFGVNSRTVSSGRSGLAKFSPSLKHADVSSASKSAYGNLIMLEDSYKTIWEMAVRAESFRGMLL